MERRTTDARSAFTELDEGSKVALLKEEVAKLPQKTQDTFHKAPVGDPSAPTSDAIWIVVVSGIVLLLLGAGFYIARYTGQGKDVDTLITVFTTSLAFLAGLFTKSPVSRDN